MIRIHNTLPLCLGINILHDSSSQGTEPMPEPDEPSSLLKKWAPQSDPNFLADWETKHRNKSKEVQQRREKEKKKKNSNSVSWGVMPYHSDCKQGRMKVLVEGGGADPEF